MSTTVRRYDHAADYEKVGRFLVRTYDPSGVHVNWLQPRWEYMHHTQWVLNVDLSAIGVWESHGRIVGVIHPEHQVGTVYVEVDPGHASLKLEMLAYAQDNLHRVTPDGAKRLQVFINDRDVDFQAAAAEMGYRKTEECEAMSHLQIADPFPPITVPGGYRLQSLADGCDVEQLAMAIWRGFDHTDAPPANNTEWRRRHEAAPNFRHDLHIIAVAPDGNIAAYCGMWYEPDNHIAYVEPVCTVPQHRRMGLGTAAVREGVRRCGQQGATIACVGTDMHFYQTIGFTPIYNRRLWKREWT